MTDLSIAEGLLGGRGLTSTPQSFLNVTVTTSPSLKANPSLPQDFINRGLWIKGTPLKLHLGCGETMLPGYINVDYQQSEHAVMQIRPDYEAELLTMEIDRGTVDEIRLHHVFEHFSRVEAIGMLMKWHSWLKPGGLIHIETPDFFGSGRVAVDPSQPWARRMGAIRHLAGDQTAKWAFHVDHWFPERFEKTLAAFRFSDITTETWTWDKEPFLCNVTAKARKGSYSLSDEEMFQAAEKLLEESLVAEEERDGNLRVWREQLQRFLAGNPIFP